MRKEQEAICGIYLIANKINGINKIIISINFIFFIYNIYPNNKINAIGKII